MLFQVDIGIQLSPIMSVHYLRLSLIGAWLTTKKPSAGSSVGGQWDSFVSMLSTNHVKEPVDLFGKRQGITFGFLVSTTVF